MHSLVKITVDDDGNPKYDAHVWHLVDPSNWQGKAALCTAEFLGEGESEVVFETKETLRGGITCPSCMKMLKEYKRVRL